ncbi:IclR family transcriptional regulator [Acinetobacter pittii]|uniref:helix-turn-helix domain-containing protein n=1 Tax=Acinetobacter pittii TaxID=48296 RepID=UPI001373C1DD|nr:helix-turn-helix domain-containing protein [Acinetobacter pittii]MBQ5174094.1 IclR family transcriptional regulator [Acinetobacter pittii]QHQ32113.1 winged helix-turn-helix transcriptional regulator [Acinetobacter pittii]USQ61783.1 IclR family transcriptional regulator [Acinetobacter pittii]UTD34374.1 IclR family transcriptional regulator [Acinetobacter pittii]
MTTVNKSASKVLKVLKALRGHSLKGATNQELANQLNESPSTITRALQTLVNEGLAMQEQDGSYTLGTAVVQMAKAHNTEIERAKARIEEVEKRTAITW